MRTVRLPLVLPLVALATMMGVLSSCDSPEKEAGVISTGNAGRIQGEVRYDDSTRGVPGVEVTLQTRLGSAWKDVDTAQTSSSGAYRFDDLGPGTYRVIAKANSGELGRSPEFEVKEGEEVRIIVLLVQVTKVSLLFVPPAGTQVISVRVEGTGVAGVHREAGWVFDLQNGRTDTLRVELSTGELRYAIAWEGNSPVLEPISGAPQVELVRLLADWTFDEPDTLRDHSGNGNTGVAHGGVSFLADESAWRFDGTSGYASLGSCIGWGGRCVDWSDTDLVLQTRIRLDTQTVSIVAHLITISAGNGEIMLKRVPGDTLAIVLASPSGWYAVNLPWAPRLHQWVDLVFICDAGKDLGTVYLDGQVAATFAIPDQLNKVSGIPPAFGAYTNGSIRLFARMDMERTRIWLGKMDSAQVGKLRGAP